jgi:hypothetical protein
MQPIVFEGFAEDCTITGRLTMFGERLSDFLNGQERFRIHHVVCNSLADGHEATIDSLSVERSELLCVVATGPRGNEKQRVSLQTARLQASIGPYIILGRLHSAPGSDVMASVLRRESMIPLTHATIAYEQAGTVIARDMPALIVNRMRVDWITPTSDAATVFPETEIRSPYASQLLKDFTGGSM